MNIRMSLPNHKIDALVEQLENAMRQRLPIVPLTTTHPDIDIDDAYQVSLRWLRRRESAGERVIGKKIGATSKAVQDMLNVHQPDFGFLTDRMQLADGATASLSQLGLIQPRAEGEIAFMLSKDLQGPGVTRQDVLDATAWVAPCFEIVDSRIRDWQIRIQDTVADNASCGVFVVGTRHIDPAGVDLSAVTMHMQRNGQPAGSGRGEAVQGHPAEAVAWLANTLGERGIPFRAGEIILSGSLAPLVPAQAGDRFTMEIDGLGGCSIAFAP